MMKAEDLLRSLEAALASELDLYRQLEALSVRQLEALERPEPDIDLTAQTMQAKCELVHRVTQLEKQHSPLKKQYEAVRETVPEQAKAKLRAVREELDQVLRHLIELENLGEQLMKDSSQELERRLKEIAKLKTAQNAYSAYQLHFGPPRFLDKRK